MKNENSKISSELLKAYSNTRYNVEELSLEIRIGRSNELLNELLKKNNVNSWAFITAWNPGSKQLTKEVNDQRHKELKDSVKDFIIFEGEGAGIDTDWPPEKSLLILGIQEEQAIETGIAFGQNAIVIGSINSIPALKILSDHI